MSTGIAAFTAQYYTQVNNFASQFNQQITTAIAGMPMLVYNKLAAGTPTTLAGFVALPATYITNLQNAYTLLYSSITPLGVFDITQSSSETLLESLKTQLYAVNICILAANLPADYVNCNAAVSFDKTNYKFFVKLINFVFQFTSSIFSKVETVSAFTSLPQETAQLQTLTTQITNLNGPLTAAVTLLTI